MGTVLTEHTLEGTEMEKGAGAMMVMKMEMDQFLELFTDAWEASECGEAGMHELLPLTEEGVEVRAEFVLLDMLRRVLDMLTYVQ